MELGRRIARCRKLKELTQAELAEAAGISKGYLVAIERGRRRPGIKTIGRIANYLHLKIDDLTNN